MNILVVDDEPGMCELLSRFLQDCGHAVQSATNGLQAWETLFERRWPADVVVADIMMPIMSGRELLRRMLEANLRIPLVLLSGQINVSQDDAVLAGAFGIIYKPFDLDDLEGVLAQVEASQPGLPCSA